MKTKDAWRSTFPRILRPGITGGSRDGRVHEIGDQGALRNADVSTQLSACNENTDLFLSMLYVCKFDLLCSFLSYFTLAEFSSEIPDPL